MAVEIAPAADLTVDKAHVVDAFVVGTPGTYTIQVANQGPSVAVGTAVAPITVTDSVPAGLVPTAATGDATRPFGTIQYVAAGAAGNFAAD